MADIEKKMSICHCPISEPHVIGEKAMCSKCGGLVEKYPKITVKVKKKKDEDKE